MSDALTAQDSVKKQDWVEKHPGTALLLISFVLIGGYLIWQHSKNQYPSTYQATFIANCEAQGKDAMLCSCTYTVLRDHYSYPKAIAMDSGQDNTDTYAWYDMIKSQCSGL
jgi:uncharacterized membrane protein